jgi:hypothetical protein
MKSIIFINWKEITDRLVQPLTVFKYRSAVQEAIRQAESGQEKLDFDFNFEPVKQLV